MSESKRFYSLLREQLHEAVRHHTNTEQAVKHLASVLWSLTRVVESLESQQRIQFEVHGAEAGRNEGER